MRKFKNIMSVILLFMVVLSSTSVYAAETLVEKHSAFGLYASDDEMDKADEYITRERFASVLSVFYGVERGNESQGGMGIFSDVSADHWAAGAIAAVCNNHCMLGYSDGTFRPKETVTFDQAVRSFVILLGYGDYSQNMGGYLVQANRLGLLGGVTASGTDKLSREQFSIMLRNALKCETLEFHSVTSNGEMTFVESGTLLEEKLDIYEINGVVKATDTMSIGLNSVLAENEMKIGDYILGCYQPIDDYIGLNCRAYYRKDEDGMCTLVYIEKNEKNSVLEISSADILPEKTTLTALTYAKKNNKIETAKILSTATMIYNGRNHTYFGLEDLTPKSGTVRLIDSDNDKWYDIIVVESFVDYYAENVRYSNGKLRITDLLGKQAVEIDIENEENKLNVYKDGALADYSELSAGNVISVAASKNLSGGKSYKLLVSNTIVTGMVETYNSSDKTVVIDGEKAELSEYYNYAKYPVEIGVVFNIHINAFGKIVALDTDVKSFGYGFITAAAKTGGVFDNELSVQIFTEKSAFEVFKTAKAVKIDGESEKDKDEILTKLSSAASEYLTKTGNSITPRTGYEQLVRFEKNANNEIIMIDTVCENAGDVVQEINFDNVQYLTGSNSAPVYIFDMSRTIESKYCYVEGVPTFYVPTDISDTEGFSVKKNFAGTGDQITCTVCLFDMDDLNVFRVAVMNRGASTSVYHKDTGSMVLVAETGQTMTDDGDVVNEIIGYNVINGGKKSILAKDEVFNAVTLNPGDVIRYGTDSDGLATVIEKTAAPDGTGTTLTAAAPYTKFYDDFRITLGRAIKKKDEYLKIHYGGDTPIDNVNILNEVNCVLIFDADAKTTKVRTGTLEDIKTDAEEGDGKGSMIFTYQNYARIRTIVIYE